MATEQIKNVESKYIKNLYGDNECAKAILDYASSRSRNSSVTNVDRLTWVISRDGRTFSRREVIEVLKALENLGCGKFVIGRRGQPSRFEWEVQMIGVGKVARGDHAEIAPLSEGEELPEETEDDEMREGLIRHSYKLRLDVTLTLDLPIDLTSKEAVRLSEFIK